MARQRSPSYPSIDLKKALNRAEVLYKNEKRHEVLISVVLKHWGFQSSGSTNGTREIAALKQFGLLSDAGSGEHRKVRLTERALNAVLPKDDSEESSKETTQILKECALSPAIHEDLWSTFNGDLPSDETLARHLIMNKNFNDKHVDKFIAQFRDTVEFAQLEKGSPNSASEGNSLQAATEAPGNRKGDKDHQDEMRELPIPLISQKVAVVKVPYPMLDEDFDYFMDVLNLLKRGLVVGKATTAETSGEVQNE